MFKKPTHYRSYLLTLWEERGQQSAEPPSMLDWPENPFTGLKQGFPTRDTLFVGQQNDLVTDEQDPEQTLAALPQRLSWMQNIDH